MISNTERLWSEVQEKEIFPAVTSLEDYEKKVVQGSLAAKEFLARNPKPVPSEEDILFVHYLVFKDVYPWAGKSRSHSQLATFGGLIGAESDRITMELKMLEVQSKELLSKTKSEVEIIKAVVFHHARFERIHPFSDGNGRVGRILLEAQMDNLFGKKERPTLERTEYMMAIKSAQTGNLNQMVNLLMKAEGMTEKIFEAVKPPYRMAPFYSAPEEKKRTLEEEILRSKEGKTLKL